MYVCMHEYFSNLLNLLTSTDTVGTCIIKPVSVSIK